MTLADALAKLDPANDDHWTADGAPKIDAVASLAGRKVTRKDITDAAPDLVRQAASEPAPPEQKPAPAEAPAAPPRTTSEEKRLRRVARQKVLETTGVDVAVVARMAPEDRERLEEVQTRMTELRQANEAAETEIRELAAVEAQLLRIADAVAPSKDEQLRRSVKAYQEQSKKARAARAARMADVQKLLGTKAGVSVPPSPLDASLKNRPRQVPFPEAH